MRPVDEYVDEDDQLLSGDHIVLLLLVNDIFDGHKFFNSC